ncbi:metal-binding protein [Acidiplasma sp.]|uniref:metal-binding protein n=1 Tax=Acidiplasma sp. TaxID=1872114 RepID=UPI00258B1365|nr:metal-binding protein [Acidiplasma sp.]
MFIDNIISFNSIEVSVLSIEKRRIIGDIKYDDNHFKLIFTFKEDITADKNIAGLIVTMPVINFTYFSRRLVLNYPLSKTDLNLIKNFVVINAREVFINKIINRRYDFIKEEYIPKDNDITEENACGITEVTASQIIDDKSYDEMDQNNVLIMSSGGKESLLGYGIFNEINANGKNYAFFFEESGAHWLTAKTAFDYYEKNFKNVIKTWSNVDRFYHEMLRHIKILRQDMINIKADDYPIQVFIFPIYIFLTLPLILKYKIGNIIMGDEFDDPREMGKFHGIEYYYGIFDQTSYFNEMMSEYLRNKGINTRVYSIVYPITGSLEEKILIGRYHDLYLNQRSCHSCHEKNGLIYPCGKCSKCLGILLFIEANGGNPKEILYSDDDIRLLERRVLRAKMRLDPDELKYTETKLGFINGNPNDYGHVNGIHILPYEKTMFSLVPENFRDNIINIINKYSDGTYTLKNGTWVKT